MEEKKEFSTAEDVLELLDLVNAAGARAYLHGGWACEAVTGISRPHGDIDLLAPEEFRPTLRSALGKWLVREKSHKLELDFGGTKVDFSFAERRRDGRIITWSPRILVVWPPDVFSHDGVAKLGGQAVPVVSK